MSEELLLRRPRLIRNCRLSESTNQENTLLMPEGVLRLKGTGVEILKLCDGVRTLGEILILLKQKFPQAEPQKIEAESVQFLNQLREKRVMEF